MVNPWSDWADESSGGFGDFAERKGVASHFLTINRVTPSPLECPGGGGGWFISWICDKFS